MQRIKNDKFLVEIDSTTAEISNKTHALSVITPAWIGITWLKTQTTTYLWLDAERLIPTLSVSGFDNIRISPTNKPYDLIIDMDGNVIKCKKYTC